MPRACVIVLDAVGAGALPDADDYGDEGADTLGNVARAVGGLDLPSLEALGLGNAEPREGGAPAPAGPGGLGPGNGGAARGVPPRARGAGDRGPPRGALEGEGH